MMKHALNTIGVVAMGILLAGCAPEKGSCPTPDDCACPCTDEEDPVCSKSGEVYQNLCTLECDGAEEGSCGGATAECVQQCEEETVQPVCGKKTTGGDTTFRCFDNQCLRECAGFGNARRNDCDPQC